MMSVTSFEIGGSKTAKNWEQQNARQPKVSESVRPVGKGKNNEAFEMKE